MNKDEKKRQKEEEKARKKSERDAKWAAMSPAQRKKQVILGVAVWVLIFGGIGSCISTSEKQSANKPASNVAVKADQKEDSAKKKAEEDANAKAAAEEKAKAEKLKQDEENVTADYVKSTVIKALGSDKANNKKDKVVEVKSNDDLGDGVPEGSKIIILTLNGNENVTDSMTKKGLWMDSIPVMKALFQNPKVYDVSIVWQLPMVDQYGNNKDDAVMEVHLIKPVAQKINWDNFIFNNIPLVSKESGKYWEHPALRKIQTD